jgi:single-strand DNA-binding protein
MSLASITITGRLTAPAEVRFTPSGKSVATFTVAASNRRKDGEQWVDTDTSFYRCVAWDKLGENVAEHLTKGVAVIVYGQLKQRDWEDKEGNKRTSWEIAASAAGPDLRWDAPKSASVKRETAEAPF